MSLRRPPLPRLLLNNVSCMRNAQQILRHVNVSLHDGGALVLMGTNGSGKSTFLRMLAGFSKPSAGEILWNGHDITQAGIFHQYKLQLNWLSLKDAIKDKFTVLDNVQWFEVLEGKQGGSLPALELMGLGRLAKDKARMLSMGQRKRVQLARLLAIDRPIWLLDEPSVALDGDGVKLLEYIIAEHRKKGGIVIVATHLPIEIEDAMYLRLPPRFPRRMTLVDMLDRGVEVRPVSWRGNPEDRGSEFSLSRQVTVVAVMAESLRRLIIQGSEPSCTLKRRMYLKVCLCVEFGLCRENAAHLVKNELKKVSLKDIAGEFSYVEKIYPFLGKATDVAAMALRSDPFRGGATQRTTEMNSLTHQASIHSDDDNYKRSSPTKWTGNGTRDASSGDVV
ncbi:hypothetical protein RHSIM_RhsimUnG0172000 [Rhododendron simsii]|uniref:ABC transporter domain-containing protein n=1 Tax=Rhododendron simsii TaxID=118357 RepID=A0A834FWB0_RHOSS|nr:hypothetical protein RHSIM_RhsimUnG0172000 [Rhododendron simsii]